MNATLPTGYGRLSPALAERIDTACDRFETAWREGRRPAIESYLEELPGPERLVLLRELLLLELLYRRYAGEIPRLEEYRERFPGLEESWLVGALGEAPTVKGLLQPDTPAPSPTAPPDIPGYEILGELGRGGMGVVYKARQVRADRLVALKMVPSGVQDRTAEMQRLRVEAAAIARLHHPHIVQVYEVGEHHGRPYFSLEFCPGGSLEQRLGGAPLPPLEAAVLVETLSRAIHAAHEKGIIHRDLKPANILLTDDDTPKITDFGLAKKLGEAGHTISGEILGTPAYMAPEQAAGRVKEVGPASDVYALGAILYECLTGRPPFQASTPLETLVQVLHREPTPPSCHSPSVPRSLEAICLKALAKEPSGRYPTAAALADDLARFAVGRSIAARPVTRLQALARWCRCNPVSAGLAALAALLAVALVLLILPRPDLAAADDSLQRVRQAGKLRVATEPTYPPMEFYRDGRLTGFDVELTRQLAGRLGVEVEFVPVTWNWDDLVRRLNEHEIDLVVSTVTITEERQQQVAFVEYLRLSHAFLCRRGVEVRSEKDLAGRIVAVQRDTKALELVRDLPRRGIAVKEIALFPDSPDPVKALLDGRADVALAHEPVARYRARQDPRLQAGGPVGHVMDPDPVGLTFRKGDRAFQAAVAESLKALRQEGAWARLLNEWFGS